MSGAGATAKVEQPGAKTLDVGWTSVLGGLGFSPLYAEKYTLS